MYVCMCLIVSPFYVHMSFWEQSKMTHVVLAGDGYVEEKL